MKSKTLGGIFLVAGTSIGAGMLGLPIATVRGGLGNSSLLFISSWILMVFTALIMLEVTLCFGKRSNMITMARQTLGRWGEALCWFTYLLLLYALVAAYVAGGQDILQGLLSLVHIELPAWISSILFVGILGSIVVAGIKHVDFFNRVLMIVKLLAITVLIALLFKNISLSNYAGGKMRYLLPAISVTITSFGFAVIIPTLRAYLDDNVRALRISILVGAFLPLVCYIAWNAAIFGAVPADGEYGLTRLIHLNEPISGLLESVRYFAGTAYVNWICRIFTTVCILTAFACVSLALSDCLADGFNLVKEDWRNQALITSATFIPPLLCVIFYPKMFILALSIGGVLCTILQALLPPMMALSARYVKKLPTPYQVKGGLWALVLAITTALFIIVVSVLDLTGLMQLA